MSTQRPKIMVDMANLQLVLKAFGERDYTQVADFIDFLDDSSNPVTQPIEEYNAYAPLIASNKPDHINLS